jgi:predicted HicB family RNase H-like nuclease
MAPKGERTSYSQPGREGKKNLIAWIDEEKHRQLKATAALHGKTMNEAVEEALDAWLSKKVRR